MQRQSRAPRRDATQNNRVVFERLWRGTFQAVLAGPARRARASSHEPTSDVALPSLVPRPAPPDALAPALRTILEGLRNSCCCRCNCNATDRNFNDNLQVCLSNDEERKSMRSVISVRETHAVAEAQQEKNARLRDAFGISPRFVEGSSLDPERRAREHAQRYPLVRTPSHERDERDPHPPKRKKKRSTSPDAKKLKKKKSKKNKKEKQEASKKKKKRSKSPPESDSSSSSEGGPDSDTASSDDERHKKKKKSMFYIGSVRAGRTRENVPFH
ncbi:unnamed protein product [Spodoptera exigua]|nr:unnamed protein product [Spodoptera exigua]